MKKLLKYMKPYSKECVLGPFLKLAEATLELLIPFLVMRIVNKGIASGDSRVIWSDALLMVLLGFLGLVFSLSAQFFCAKEEFLPTTEMGFLR